MKISIVGAGAIGGYLGAKLALAGVDVTFIARNQNLAAINARGFRLIWKTAAYCMLPRFARSSTWPTPARKTPCC